MRRGTLVVLACHCVYDPATDLIYTDRPEFARDRPVYESQLDYGCRHPRMCDDPLLVISGAPTKAQRRCSESRSYVEWTQRLGMHLPAEIALEEFALTSIENLLFGLYVYRESRGVYPERIDVISWEFKRRRFVETLRAISAWAALGESWPGLDYFPVGDVRADELRAIEPVEFAYIDALRAGLDAYYANAQTQAAIARRDVYGTRIAARQRYGAFPLPF
jgi:hypothetical protein